MKVLYYISEVRLTDTQKIKSIKPTDLTTRGDQQELEEFQEAGLGIKNKPSQCPPSLETQLLYNN